MKTISIQGLSFPVEDRYTEGHCCNAAEAAELNKNFREALRNNFLPKVKRLLSTPDSPERREAIGRLEQEFLAYAANYNFGSRMSAVDPILHEARRLARGKVLSKLREQGNDVKIIAEADISRLVDKVLSDYPSLMEEARKRVEAYQNIAISALEL